MTFRENRVQRHGDAKMWYRLTLVIYSGTACVVKEKLLLLLCVVAKEPKSGLTGNSRRVVYWALLMGFWAGLYA